MICEILRKLVICDCDDFQNANTGLKELVTVKLHSSVVKAKNYEYEFDFSFYT